MRSEWDPSSYCMEQLDTNDQSRKELLVQLTTVSRRVFSLILERQSNCSSQLEPIVKVQEQLGEGMDLSDREGKDWAEPRVSL